jgi:hypothetical protein
VEVDEAGERDQSRRVDHTRSVTGKTPTDLGDHAAYDEDVRSLSALDRG